MPDPVEWLLALLAAGGSSAAVILAFGRRWRTSLKVSNIAGMLACVVGVVLGYAVFRLHPAWPPANALDRLLVIVLPAVVVVELLAAASRMPGRLIAMLRIALAIGLARILLHGSVYFKGHDGDGSDDLPATALLLAGGFVIAAFWYLTLLLNRRSPAGSLPVVLALAIACGGAAILLAGYIRGGEAALPLAASLAATGLALAAMKAPYTGEGLIGVGVVGLAGLLVVGHFFGRLTTIRALAIFSSPLICWAAELPAIRTLKPWQAVALRLLLTAIPLIIALVMAVQDFRGNMPQVFVLGS